ncbi:MAG: ABC transporter permease [Crenarchaeota archaeon]|nr:ABC transporter permease [Thermoproteota archaeon]
MSSRKLQVERSLVLFYGAFSFAIMFILIPIVSLFLFFNYHVLLKIFNTPILISELRSAFVTTFEAASLSTSILLIIGVPVAYVLARREFKAKPIVEAIIDMPFVVPHPVVGIMLLTAFGSRGLIPLNVEDTFWGVVLVMLFVSAPLLIDTVKLGFASIDVSIEHVARSLGASFYRTFFSILLPLCSRSIIAGIILALARSLSEVGALLVLAYFPKTVNILILEWLDTLGLPYAIAVSCLYLIVIFAMFIALRVVTRSYVVY